MPVLIRNSRALIEALHSAQTNSVWALELNSIKGKPAQKVLLQSRLVKGKRIMDCTPSSSSWKSLSQAEVAGWSSELSAVTWGWIHRAQSKAQLSGAETTVCSTNTVPHMLFMHICFLCSPFLSQALNIWKLVEKSLLGQDDSTSACLHPSHRISPLLRPSFTASFLFHISMEICQEMTAWSCSLSSTCTWLLFLGSPAHDQMCLPWAAALLTLCSCSAAEPAPPLVPNPQPDASPSHLSFSFSWQTQLVFWAVNGGIW